MGQKTNSIIFRLGLKNAEWKSKYIEKNLEESSLFLHRDIEIRNHIDRIFKYHGLILHSCKIEHTQASVNCILLCFEKRSETKIHYEQNRKKNLKIYSPSSFLYTNWGELAVHIGTILKVSLNIFLAGKTVNITIKNLYSATVSRFNLNKNSKSLTKKNKNTLNEVMKPFRRFLKDKLFKEMLKGFWVAVTEKNSSKLVAEVIGSYFIKNKKRHNFMLFFVKTSLFALISSKFSRVNGIKILISGRLNGAQRARTRTIQVGKIPRQSLSSVIDYYLDTIYTPNGTFGIKVWICEKS